MSWVTRERDSAPLGGPPHGTADRGPLPTLPDFLGASAQLMDGGPGHQSGDGAKVTSEDQAGASETTLRPGQTQSVLGLKQAVLNCGDKSASPGSQGRRLPALG